MCILVSIPCGELISFYWELSSEQFVFGWARVGMYLLSAETVVMPSSHFRKLLFQSVSC